MTADQLKTLTTDALDRLATLLDEGHSERLTALLKTMGRFHRYSFHNLCLITAQCPTATRVAGFQTWRTMGRFVRKGEKGIAILAPIVGRRRIDAADDDSKAVLGFRAAYVFDIASTDGEPLPEAAEASGDPGSKTAALRAAIIASGIVVESSDDLDGARGTSAGGRIQILNGLSPAEELVVLAHEWAHLCTGNGYVTKHAPSLRAHDIVTRQTVHNHRDRIGHKLRRNCMTEGSSRHRFSGAADDPNDWQAASMRVLVSRSTSA